MSVSRLVRAGLLVLFLAVGVGLVWWFVYRVPPRPSHTAVDGLSAPAEVAWTGERMAALRAQGDVDAWTALGYAHGMERAWSAVLWRQTALGRLAEWFGAAVRPLDAHARRLGLAAGARTAYAQLDDTTQAHLRAHARGMNAALQSRRVHQQAEFALLNQTPPRWAPWHTLAVERLFAWLGTPRLSVPDTAPPGLREFVTADAQVRRWLHLHGFRRSVVWTAPSGSDERQALVHRFVTGASALPTVQEITVERPDRPPLSVATLPGTPMLWTGAQGGAAWGLLPTSTARLSRTAVDSGTVRRRHERIETLDGPETLVTVRHTDSRLLLGPHTASPDSAWTLEWSGLGPVSDAHTWTRLFADGGVPRTRALEFELLDGHGLHVHPSGNWTVLGSPPTTTSLPGGVFVGRAPWAQRQAEGLHALLRTSASGPSEWSIRDSSTWAAQVVPPLLSAVAPLDRPGAPPLLRDAVTYLRNWDASFDRSSIGASLFDVWMRSYRRTHGALAPTDSLYFASYRFQKAFAEAVEILADTYGPDLRRWRWENVAPHRRYFPVWSADSLVGADLSRMATTQFAPLARRGSGHVSVPAGGPSRAAPTWPAPSPGSWTGWTTPGRTSLLVRRFRFDPSAFMARPFMPRRRPAPIDLATRPVEATTRLLPP